MKDRKRWNKKETNEKQSDSILGEIVKQKLDEKKQNKDRTNQKQSDKMFEKTFE